MKKQKKYLTSTEQYERWKIAFCKEMSNTLRKIFEKKSITASLYIKNVDKWNVWFVINDLSPQLERLQDKLVSIIDSTEKSKPGRIYCKITANTREELDAVIGYLSIAV